MEESYKARLEREGRERAFQKKKRLENARRVYLDFLNDSKPFNLGVKYHMIDQLADELARYLDMVDCRRVLTEMLEFMYDPSMRPEDPVNYFAKLTKDRKKDKRELNKARRYLYQLMWKEYGIKEEITKLKILLGLTNPREFHPDGAERTDSEKELYDNTARNQASENLVKVESLKSLKDYKDERIPPVFGTSYTPAPEPVAVSGKEIMAERAALLEKKKKKSKGSKKRSTASGGWKGKRSRSSTRSTRKSRASAPRKSQVKERSRSKKRSSTKKRSRSAQPK